MVRILFYAVIAYVVLVIAVYFLQRHMQYFPNKSDPGSPEKNGLPGMKVVRTTTEDGLSLLAWFMPPADKNGKILVFYHGNAGHIGHRAVKARYFIERGYGVFFAEYRGFGGNPGSPTEEGLYKDARAALKWLEAQGYLTRQIILYGESIGSGVAVQIAKEIQPDILILEAPFSSALDVAKRTHFWLPVDWMMKDRYDSLSKIPDVKSQLLIVHGDEDNVIPIHLAKKLFEAANHPKEFITINGGGHSDLYDHHVGHVIRDWLDKTLAEKQP